MATNIYLEQALNDKSYESLGKWKYTNLQKYSLDKNLFPYQIKALENAIIALSIFYAENKTNRKALYNMCRNKGMNEGTFNVQDDRKIKKKSKENSFELFNKYYEITNNGDSNYISEKNFFNRMCFWMATASGKTLVLIKLIEIIDYYVKNGLMPDKDFLILLPDENAQEQFADAVREYNIASDIIISLESLKDYDDKKNFASWGNERIVYIYRTDLLSENEKSKKIDVEQYENNGNWYIFLDEAHKGLDESSIRKNYIRIMSRNGFLFNFSATFTDEIDYATTCYNFNLERFIESEYGKQIYLSDSTFTFNKKQDDLSRNQKQIEVLKSLILLSILKEQKEDGFYHNPLMLTLAHSVTKEDSDVAIFFEQIANVANGKCKDALFNKAKTELYEEFKYNKNYTIGSGKLKINFNADINKITIKKILKHIYNSNRFGEIEILEGEKNKELALKLASADEPFALIRIGETAEYIKNNFKGKYQINKNYSVNKKYFSEINNEEGQTFNIVIGSKMFYEGWDSNRPNIINFINIGGDDAKKYVLQSIGRGVRIQPIEKDKSNRKRLEYDNIHKNHLLETLFVFATNRNAIENIISTLDTSTNGAINSTEIELMPNTETIELLIPIYKCEKKNTDDILIKNFRISKNSLDYLKNYFNNHSDRLLLLKYGISKELLEKTKELINNELSFKIDEDYLYEDMGSLLKKVLGVMSNKSYKVDRIDKIVDKIVHFKHIRVNNEYYENINRIIKDYEKNEKFAFNVEDIKEKLVNNEISIEEVLKMKEDAEHRKNQEYFQLKFKSIVEHYFTPIIYSSDENIDYINHIIKHKSEVDFIEGLIKHIKTVNRDEKFDWMFSRIDETLDKDIGMPYISENEVKLFFPDFIFWLKKGKKYKIIFVDPKGSKYVDYQNKVDGFVKLFIENNKPKIFKFHDYDIIVELVLINDKPVIESDNPYFKFWKQNFDFSWLNID